MRHEAKMLQTASADDQKSDHHQRQVHTAIVAAVDSCTAQHCAKSSGEIDGAEESRQELQAAVGRELLGAELDTEIAVVNGAERGYLEPHSWGLLGGGELRWRALSNYHTGGPFSFTSLCRQ